MSKFPQQVNCKGSLNCIQRLINNYPFVLDIELKQQIGLANYIWLSPLKKDGYSEYRDQDFLDLLQINKLPKSLESFWPSRGPQWDGLGKTSNGEVFLIEAKANIPEVVSPPCQASSKDSIKLIKNSLYQTKEYINSTSVADWSSYFYQYTNRLAHLYYLRVLNDIPAYLVFIYFINDSTVNGPKTKEEWIAALTVMKEYLGINKKHKLSKHIIDVFIDVKQIGL